jgi:BlaI family transcriptional regulator, penicillinase repressor
MTREQLRVTDTELAILEVLWDRQGATIGEITADLYGNRTTARYATVQKLLERLEAKGCVSRDRSGFAHQFSATVERAELIGHRLREVAEKLCEGSLTPLLVHLVEATKFSPRDRKRLQKLIDEAQSRRDRSN